MRLPIATALLLLSSCETGADARIPDTTAEGRVAVYEGCLAQRRGDECFCAGVAGGWQPATIGWMYRRLRLDCGDNPGHFYVDGGVKTLAPGGLPGDPK